MNKTPEATSVRAKYIFIDVDDFTFDRSAEAQSDIIRALNSIVKTIIKELGITTEKVLFLPRGDGLGVALLDIESPDDIHLSIALRIVREVSRYSRSRSEDEMRQFKVRVGIDANTDNLITDINGNRNIAGAGVNIASSVMNLADGNQILVSDPVFESLSRQEKYILSFKNFRAKIKHGLELPVHQFIEAGHEGLDVSIPQSLLNESAMIEPRAKAKVEAPPSPPMIKPENQSRIGRVEFENKKSNMTAGLPALSPDIISPESDKQAVQTHSYLTGVLAEQNKAKTAQAEPKPATSAVTAGAGWIKPKPQSVEFLEKVAPPSSNRAYLTAGLVVLLLVAAGLGAWMFSSGNNEVSLENNSNNSAATVETASGAGAKTPAAAAPIVAPTVAANDKDNNVKSNQDFTSPKQPTVTDTKTTTTSTTTNSPSSERQKVIRSAPEPNRRDSVRRVTVAVSAPVKTTNKAATKRQTSKETKSPKRVTLDDLIGGN